MYRFHRAAAAFAVLALTTAALSACSTDDDKGSLEGAINVMTIGVFDAPTIGFKVLEIPGAIEARAAAINEAGGINGKNVNVMVCNTKGDANEAALCAREAISNKVTAVVKMSILPTEDPSVWPLLERAGIPVIGTATDQPIASDSPIAFGLTNDAAANSGGGSLLKSAGATKVSVLLDAGVRTEDSDEAYGQPIRDAGVDLGAVVYVDGSAVDLSPYIAQATADGVDGVYVASAADSTQVDGIVRAFETQGYKGLIGFPASALTADAIEELGDRAEGIVSISSVALLNSSAPGVKQFKEDMSAFDKTLALNDSSISAWTSMLVFEKVAETLDTVDAKTVLKAMSNIKDLDTDGIIPPLTTGDRGAAIPGQPNVTRIFNAQVVYAVVKGGELVAMGDDGGFNDPYAND